MSIPWISDTVSFLFTAELQWVLQPDEQQGQEEGWGEEGGGGEGGEGEGGRGYNVMEFKKKTKFSNWNYFKDLVFEVFCDASKYIHIFKQVALF